MTRARRPSSRSASSVQPSSASRTLPWSRCLKNADAWWPPWPSKTAKKDWGAQSSGTFARARSWTTTLRSSIVRRAPHLAHAVVEAVDAQAGPRDEEMVAEGEVAGPRVGPVEAHVGPVRRVEVAQVEVVIVEDDGAVAPAEPAVRDRERVLGAPPERPRRRRRRPSSTRLSGPSAQVSSRRGFGANCTDETTKTEFPAQNDAPTTRRQSRDAAPTPTLTATGATPPPLLLVAPSKPPRQRARGRRPSRRPGRWRSAPRRASSRPTAPRSRLKRTGHGRAGDRTRKPLRDESLLRVVNFRITSSKHSVDRFRNRWGVPPRQPRKATRPRKPRRCRRYDHRRSARRTPPTTAAPAAADTARSASPAWATAGDGRPQLEGLPPSTRGYGFVPTIVSIREIISNKP